MKYDPNKHHRRSIRLKGYDYTTAGAYFITICTDQRQCLFGEIVDGKMELNATGMCVQACWQSLPHHFETLELDTFVVMPNHLHGILRLGGDIGKGEAFGRNKLAIAAKSCIECFAPTTQRYATGVYWGNYPKFQICFNSQN